MVDATTISTSINQLTNHLKTEDFFHVDEFAHAGFESRSVALISGDRYQVVGDMTLRGTTLEHTFEATIVATRGDATASQGGLDPATREGHPKKSGGEFKPSMQHPPQT